VYVFLDEVNTCAHMGLICEAICHNSLNGRPIDSRIKVRVPSIALRYECIRPPPPTA
jgi:hypothetical protein